MPKTIDIQGSVTFVPVSGGFWGIVDDDGSKYRPVGGVPEPFQQEGRRVRVQARAVVGFSIFMWGRDVAILDIQAI